MAPQSHYPRLWRCKGSDSTSHSTAQRGCVASPRSVQNPKKIKKLKKAISRQTKKKRGAGVPPHLQTCSRGSSVEGQPGRRQRMDGTRYQEAACRVAPVCQQEWEQRRWRCRTGADHLENRSQRGGWGIFDFVPLSASAGSWREQSPRSRYEISFAACSQVLILLIYVFYFIFFVVLSSFNPARPAGAGAKSRGHISRSRLMRYADDTVVMS